MTMEFIKHDAVRFKRVGFSWRKPRGKKNKTKAGKKGHRPMPSKGFMSDRSKRGMIAGKTPILVHNINDVHSLNDQNIVIIASAVGNRKRKEIASACDAKKLKILNYGKLVKDTEKTSK